MNQQEGALVTDHSSHQIYIVRDGKFRWVPDAWTMQAAGASPADLIVVEDGEITPEEVGSPLPTTIPAPKLEDGAVVETEEGVWKFDGGRLTRILDPMELVVEDGLDARSVVFLPQSVVRALIA